MSDSQDQHRPLLELDRFSRAFRRQDRGAGPKPLDRSAASASRWSANRARARALPRCRFCVCRARGLSGRMLLDGEDLLQKTEQQMRGLRGADVAMVFQEPMTALNPLFTIGKQIAESLRLHEGLRPNAARKRGIELLAAHRHSRAGAAHRQFSASTVRRPAPARDDRDGAGVPAASAACRRTDHRARRDRRAADRRTADRVAGTGSGRARHGRAADHARPESGEAFRAARGGDGEGRAGGEQHGRSNIFASPQHPYTQRLLDSRPERTVVPVLPIVARVARSARGLRRIRNEAAGRRAAGSARGAFDAVADRVS